MVKYPLEFTVTGSTPSGIAETWHTSVPASSPLVMAIPPEFEGPGGGYSPEDLYALALLNCYAATFKVIAEKSRLVYTDLKLSGQLTVDRNEGGVPWMKHFKLSGELTGASDHERALRLMHKTSESCLILNSVKTEKSFEFSVV